MTTKTSVLERNTANVDATCLLRPIKSNAVHGKSASGSFSASYHTLSMEDPYLSAWPSDIGKFVAVEALAETHLEATILEALLVSTDFSGLPFQPPVTSTIVHRY